MTKPDFQLTKDTLAALLEATRIDNPKMADALHDVLVLGKRPSHIALLYGIKRQQIETRAAHVIALKSSFDKYAALIHAHCYRSNNEGDCDKDS